MRHTSGKSNFVADFLSRHLSIAEDTEVVSRFAQTLITARVGSEHVYPAAALVGLEDWPSALVGADGLSTAQVGLDQTINRRSSAGLDTGTGRVGWSILGTCRVGSYLSSAGLCRSTGRAEYLACLINHISISSEEEEEPPLIPSYLYSPDNTVHGYSGVIHTGSRVHPEPECSCTVSTHCSSTQTMGVVNSSAAAPDY